jgi:myosin-7
VEEPPPEPTARTQPRMSLRLGDSFKTLEQTAHNPEAESSKPEHDRFAKLRALAKDKGLAATSLAPVVDNETSPEPAAAKDDDDLDLEKLASELAIGVTYYSMEDYVRDNFNLQRKGLFGKQTTVNKILNWKEELIKKPLHKMPDRAMEAESVQAFKNIVSYMGQRNSSKDDIGHATKLLANSVRAPEVFRDEIFCQIIKQTRGNPDPESTVKGWQLMAIVAGTFPPSKKLEKYLMSYCDENTKDSLSDGTRVHPGVKPFAKYTMMRIKKSMSLGPRKEVPTAMEIQAARDRQPVVIRVHLLNGHYKTVPAECWTTLRELNIMVAKKLKINDATPFATFEVSSNDEERVLEDDDRVLDLLSYWQREFGNTKKGKAPPTFQFVYKLRLFFDIADTDSAAIDLAYIQAVHDVTDSRYPCNEEDCLTLAALQAQEQFGDYSGTSPFKEDGLTNFLPSKYLKGDRQAELEESIIKIYTKLKGYSSTEAKLNYLDYVKSWKIYGSAYFFVEPQNSREFPSDVVLGINAKGILVVDPETKDFLAEYPYSEVVTWGHSAQTFVLVVGNLIRQTKIYFRTDQGVEMNSLVHAYVNKLLDRDQ